MKDIGGLSAASAKKHVTELLPLTSTVNTYFFLNGKILTSDTLTRKEVKWWPKDRENRKPGYGLIIKKAS